jgi:NAD(P) transhydrogenase
MEEITVDLAVIGSGPAGQKGAIQAAKFGKKVVVIERDQDPGGTCLYTGTIPSKTLREAILDLTGFRQKSFYGKDFVLKKVTLPELNFRLCRVIQEEKDLIHRQFDRNEIRFVNGVATFDDPHTLIVHSSDGTPIIKIISEFILIAGGSQPRRPADVPFDNDVILDSNTLLQINSLPETMLVLGGGIIGSEYASFLAALGVKVTVIDKKDQMLPLLDHEIGRHLQNSLTEIGLQFLGSKMPDKISRRGNKAHVLFKDGTEIEADVLLYALGREAYVAPLAIEKAGLFLNERGYIPVNPLFQTVQNHIFAAGDVIGGPCLASTSQEQARLAIRFAFGYRGHYFPKVFPLCIWTIPEISSCGYTEEELQALDYRYEIGRAYYYEIARSHIEGVKTGLIKLLFHKETLEILGAHIIGHEANELIHIAQVAMHHRAKIETFIDQVFNYPSYAEGFRVAALNGINKIPSAR